MTVIGLSGKARSGKDTIADYLVTQHGYTKVAFADTLKQFVVRVLQLPESYVYGPSENRELKVYHNRSNPDPWPQVRDRMDIFARSFCRALYRQEYTVSRGHMVDSLYESVQDLCRNPHLTTRLVLQTLGTEWARESVDKDIWVHNMAVRLALIKGNVVISDARFANEVAFCKEQGQVFRVLRNSGDTGTHLSETALDAFDLDSYTGVIHNNGTKEELYEQLEAIVNPTVG